MALQSVKQHERASAVSSLFPPPPTSPARSAQQHLDDAKIPSVPYERWHAPAPNHRHRRVKNRH